MDLNYNTFVEVLQKKLHENEKKDLIEKIAQNPERFVGCFRPTNPKTKLKQFITQSHEIRFGDAIEEVLEHFISDMGYINLFKRITLSTGEVLDLDQHFKSKEEKYFFVEQKIRDDHDSTKKRGQFSNFEKKYMELRKIEPNIVGIMYFVDPSLKKNRNYYLAEMDRMKKSLGANVYIFYGQEFFDFFNETVKWDNLIKWLETWKKSLPELMEINFDVNPHESFEELKQIEIVTWRKIINNIEIWEQGLMKEIFKRGETINLIAKFLHEKGYIKEAKKLDSLIKEYI